MSLSVRQLHANKVTSWQRRAVDVARVAVPALVEVVLIGIGDVLYAAVEL